MFTPFNSGNPLASMFDWAGPQFPFAGATDLTVSVNTTWSDAVGFKKVKKLTIAAGVTITITKSPFFLFAEEIVGGGAGCIIDASGPNGTASGVFTCSQAWGATAVDGSGRAQGGCGGGILFIITNKFSGTPIKIKSNGGNGYCTATYGSAKLGYGGQGAFSTVYNRSATSGEDLTGFNPYAKYLTSSSNGGGKAGGSGRGDSTNSDPEGGSGIASGGGNSAGSPRLDVLNLYVVWFLAMTSCKGGGAAGAMLQPSTSGLSNQAGGGGAGAVVVYTNDATSIIPTIEANGGIGISQPTTGTAGNGGAGFIAYINLAA